MNATSEHNVKAAGGDATLRKVIFTRVSLPLLAIGLSIFQFAWLYERQSEEDRLQRQCQVFISALADHENGWQMVYGWMKGNEGATQAAHYLALTLNLKPANRAYCDYPD